MRRQNAVTKRMKTLSGIFFILPCIDSFAKVDLRSRVFDVPPQEVSLFQTCCYNYTPPRENTFWCQNLENWPAKQNNTN